MSRVYYQEEQRFNQWWIWLIIILLAGFWLWQLVQQIFLGIPFGDNPAPDFVVILIGLFPIGTLILFRYLILETSIDDEGVHYRFKLFQRKPRLIKAADIATVEVKKYSPLMDYGGWGIRYGNTKKAMHTTSAAIWARSSNLKTAGNSCWERRNRKNYGQHLTSR